MKQLFLTCVLFFSYSTSYCGGGKPSAEPSMVMITPGASIAPAPIEAEANIRRAFPDLFTLLIANYHAQQRIASTAQLAQVEKQIMLKQLNRPPTSPTTSATNELQKAQDNLTMLVNNLIGKELPTSLATYIMKQHIAYPSLISICARSAAEILQPCVATQIACNEINLFIGIQEGSIYYPPNLNTKLEECGFSKDFCDRWLEQTNRLLLPKKE